MALHKYTRDKLTTADVAAILGTAKSAELEPGDHLFLHLLAKTGRRIGEILGDARASRHGMRPKDIEWDQKFAWLSVEKRRDDSEYICFLTDEMLEELRVYIHALGIGPEEELFLHQPKRSAIGTYKRLPQVYADLAGIGKHISAHSFRHHFITTLREQGWAYEDIQKLTGHKSIASMASYDHTSAKMVEGRFREALGGI
ncbi:site-specific integrase [Candidatus Pacearchaeota archaeon]|jgi:integrase|nr:site-specific integrase [Candidatus Pacearchaeota archaeon]